MPIGIDRFDEEPEALLDLTEGTQPYRILSFLATGQEHGIEPLHALVLDHVHLHEGKRSGWAPAARSHHQPPRTRAE